MLQAQSYSTVLDMAFMLPINEQVQLVQRIQENVLQHNANECLNESLRISRKQALAGECLSQEEAHQMMQSYVESVEAGIQEIENGDVYTNEQVIEMMQDRLNDYKHRMAV